MSSIITTKYETGMANSNDQVERVETEETEIENDKLEKILNYLIQNNLVEGGGCWHIEH